MHAAARLTAAMLIAVSVLLPTSITTSTQASITLSGAAIRTCADSGEFFSHCTAELTGTTGHPLFDPTALADIAASGGWNTFSFGYQVNYYMGAAPEPPRPTVTAGLEMADTITITGGTGQGILAVQFGGGKSGLGATTVWVKVNDSVFPLFVNDVLTKHAFDVPFEFGIPFDLMVGITGNGAPGVDIMQSGGGTNVVLLGPEIYTFLPEQGGTRGNRIYGATVVRASGADFGVPEPSALALTLTGLALIAARVKLSSSSTRA